MRLLPGVPSEPDGAVGAFLDKYPHAFTRKELLSHWSRHHFDAAVAEASVSRLLPGIYASTRHVRRSQLIAEAATLWAPRSLVTGAPALHLYDHSLPAPGHVDLTTANGDTLHPPHWIRVHQAGRPREHGLPCGVPSTLPARAALDAWRYSPAHLRRDIVWNALWSRVCTWRQLARELKNCPRVTGRPDLERILGWFEEGATSPLEVRAKHETFLGPAFREFEWQAGIALADRTVRVDMLHRRAELVVELDGDTYHSTREDRQADRDRQNAMVAGGFTVLRFGWADVVDRPNWCRESLLRVLESRL